jgi:hypothetical protein
MSDQVEVLLPDTDGTVVLKSTAPAEVHVVTTAAEQGPPGPRGPIGPAGGAAVERMTDGPIAALIAVWEDEDGVVRPLDNRDVAHIDRLIGITTAAAAGAGLVTVQGLGALDVSDTGLPEGPVWLGADGALVPAPPEEGVDVRLGTLLGAGRLFIHIFEPIL